MKDDDDKQISFANHPKSITEIKGDKSFDAKDWKPRDALIAALRDIDNGIINPKALIISIKNVDKDITFYAASTDVITSLGILEWVKLRIYLTGKDDN